MIISTIIAKMLVLFTLALEWGKFTRISLS